MEYSLVETIEQRDLFDRIHVVEADVLHTNAIVFEIAK